MTNTKVLVLIPILNPEVSFYKENIPLLLQQNIEAELVLINSGKSLESTSQYKVVNIDKKEFNHANTRNIVFEFEADFYLFMTQDAKPYDNRLIEKLLVPLENEDIVLSYARHIPYEDAHITERFARENNYPKESLIKSKKDISTLGIKTYFSSDSCAMYKAEYFRTQNGFTQDLDASEDMEFAARAILDDKKIAYCSDAKVYHSHIYTMKSLYKRYVTIGKFFKENSWIEESIRDSISTESTGYKQVLEEFKYILRRRPTALFKSFIFNVIKYIAYKVGKS